MCCIDDKTLCLNLIETVVLYTTQWYEGDVKRIQYSCRHRNPYETEEEVKKMGHQFSRL